LEILVDELYTTPGNMVDDPDWLRIQITKLGGVLD
jgi:hypothetical protein